MSIAKSLAAVAVAASLYGAGVHTSDTARDKYFSVTHPHAIAAQGYLQQPYAWHTRMECNSEGRIEVYLEGENQRLPFLQGAKGPQLGTDDYLLANASNPQSLLLKGFRAQPDEAKMALLEQQLASSPDSVRSAIVNEEVCREIGSFCDRVIDELKTLVPQLYQQMKGVIQKPHAPYSDNPAPESAPPPPQVVGVMPHQ